MNTGFSSVNSIGIFRRIRILLSLPKMPIFDDATTLPSMLLPILLVDSHNFIAPYLLLSLCFLRFFPRAVCHLKILVYVMFLSHFAYVYNARRFGSFGEKSSSVFRFAVYSL